MSYEQWLAALCLWREARGCTLLAKRAIYWVILNRARDSKGRWPKTVPGVILQHAQFSSFLQSDPNCIKFPQQGDPVDWAAFQSCQAAVSDSLGADPTSGANSYESCPPDKMPSWADPTKVTIAVDGIRFYKL
jgi:hypothetical protein